MSTHITGKLIVAGDYSDSEQLDPQSPMARVVIVMRKESLRDVKLLPMYDDVTVIRTAELAALWQDKNRLDSGRIRLIHRNEFGEDVVTIHCGLDMRAKIDAALK